MAKKTISSVLSKQIKDLEAKVKEVEETLVETVVDAIQAPKPKDGERGDKGEAGKSIKGDKGESGRPGKNIKGDKGDIGESGISIKGDKGESGVDGTDGLGFVTGKFNDEGDLIIERTDGAFINIGNIKREIIRQTIHTGGGGGASVPPSRLLPIDANKGNILVNTGTDWIKLAVGTNDQALIADSAQTAGVKWGEAGIPNPSGKVKGDMLVYNGTDWINLAVGANDEVVTADSAQASGVKWATAGSVRQNITNTYNVNGQLLTTTLADGNVFTNTYNSDGTIATIVDDTNTWTYAYTANQLITVTVT